LKALKPINRVRESIVVNPNLVVNSEKLAMLEKVRTMYAASNAPGSKRTTITGANGNLAEYNITE
jgi:hypothetical protein